MQIKNKWMEYLETHISKKIKGTGLIKASILLATYDLQQKYPKTKHVRFY